MAKKKRNKISNRKQVSKSLTRKSSGSNKQKLNHIPIVNNLLLTIGFLSLFYYAINNGVGYIWVKDTLIGANLETIKKNRDITFDQKIESKLGFSAKYMRFLVQNSPDTAVILMPPSKEIFRAGLDTDFDKYAKSKTWGTYFVYPRKLVFEDEKETSSLYAKVTHVAIMNGWGYDKVNYPVKNGGQHTIIPLNK